VVVEIEIIVPGIDDGSNPEPSPAFFFYDLGWANWRQFFLKMSQTIQNEEGE